MTRVEKLMLRVQMIDQASGPANKLAASLDRITDRAKQGFSSIVQGGVGLVATGFILNRLTTDAREMNRALGGMRTLGVEEDALASLQKRAKSFSITFGESATDFMHSSYMIKSSINGLVGDELAAFTEAGNILAKGTKSDAKTITSYMGTMYDVFQTTADAMGRSKWVEMLTGQTAAAVQMFKTDGKEMAGAFSRLGANATSGGIKMGEQFAILGKLQGSMGSGSEAGTAYNAFLRGVGKAQDALGLKFTDSAGRMLPMIDILTELQSKFGDIDKVAESDALNTAFGSAEATKVIKLLMKDMGGLSGSIEHLNKITGNENAAKMASDLVDPLDRLNQASINLKTSFGEFLLQSLNPFYDSVTEGMGTLEKWTQMFPHLTGLIAKVTLGVFSFTAALSGLLVLKGVYILTTLALGTAWGILRVAMIPFGPLLTAIRMGWLVLNMQLAAGAGIIPALKAAWVALRTQLVINTLAVWKLNAAFWANPITWIVGGIIALVGALVALYMNWDKVTVWMGKAWTIIRDNPILSFLVSPLLLVVDAIGFLFDAFKKLAAWVGTLNIFEALGSGVDWLIDKINLIPGINIGSDGMDVPGRSRPGEGSDQPLARANHVPPGGLMEQINNSSSRSTHIEKLEVNTNQSVNGYTIADELQMAAG